MTLKPDRKERRDAARRRLREQASARPVHSTSPRGNAEIDQGDFKRELERLEAVLGR